MKVSTGSGGEDRSIGKGEGHGWELGRAHEVGKRGEDRLTKEDMGSARIVRFQRGDGVRVKETRDWGRRDFSRHKRVGGMR